MKIYEPTKLPLRQDTYSYTFQIEESSLPQSKNEEKFLEGCEWIYKCPLKFEELEFKTKDRRYCKECNKHVFLVSELEDFKERVSSGQCVAFKAKEPKNEPRVLMGRVCF